MDHSLYWLSLYLSGKHTTVRFANGCSEPFDVVSWVPQGSLLGPNVFNLFMNEIGGVLDFIFLFCADYMKLFDGLRAEEDSHTIQRSLDNIRNWCSVNRKQFKPSKVHRNILSGAVGISYRLATPRGTAVQPYEVLRDLGVYINHSFTPVHHI